MTTPNMPNVVRIRLETIRAEERETQHENAADARHIRALFLDDPFAVIDEPTPADVAEFLRHTNAQYAYDRAVALRHKAERSGQ